jgi:hypothetical protein
VPTLSFDRLFAFLVLGHGRRQLLWFEVTGYPTAEWLARQSFTHGGGSMFLRSERLCAERFDVIFCRRK